VDVFVLASEFSDADALRRQVRRWERLGLSAVIIIDRPELDRFMPEVAALLA